MRALAHELGTVDACLRYVQALPYRADPAGTSDYVADVAVTLRCGGDCEDLSAALVALLVVLGVGSWLVWITQERAALDHVTVQVEGAAGALLWAETTVQGARLGEEPRAAARRVGVRVPGLW